MSDGKGCTVAGCDAGKRVARGMCWLHYQRWRRGQPLEPPNQRTMERPVKPCAIADCDRDAKCRGLCHLHYQRWRKGRPVDGAPWAEEQHCSIEGCVDTVRARGMCRLHYERWRRGHPMTPPKRRGRRPMRNVGACILDGCDRRQYSRHLCRNHYSVDLRKRKQGLVDGPPGDGNADGR